MNRYIYGNGKRLAKVDVVAGGKRFYHSDQLGSTRVVTDSVRNVKQSFDYYPFGNIQTTAGASTDYRFNGKEFDEEDSLNLYYYGARFYDPQIGRFISIDPIVNYTNPYSYVHNNPLNYTDPTGMEPSGKIYGWRNLYNHMVRHKIFLSDPEAYAERNNIFLQKQYYIDGMAATEDMAGSAVQLNESIERSLREIIEDLREESEKFDGQPFTQLQAIVWTVYVSKKLGLDPAAGLALIMKESSLNPDVQPFVEPRDGSLSWGFTMVNEKVWGNAFIKGVDLSDGNWKYRKRGVSVEGNPADNIVVGLAIYRREYGRALDADYLGDNAYRAAYSVYSGLYYGFDRYATNPRKGVDDVFYKYFQDIDESIRNHYYR